MESALIICESQKVIQFFTDFLTQNFCTDISVVHGAEEAKRLLIERDFDVCIINAPLRNEFGEKLSINIAEKNICQVILVVKSEMMEEITEKVEDYGIITVAKPLNKNLLWSALKLAKVAQRRLAMMQKENHKLKQRLEDIKIVNQAKCVLISYLGMSEDDAHRYIEKQAMDMRMSRRDISENILNTYEKK